MKVNIQGLELAVDKTHRYGVGFKNKNGTLFPVQSYRTREELEKGYLGLLYIMGENEEFGELIPFERNGVVGSVLREIIEKYKSKELVYG